MDPQTSAAKGLASVVILAYNEEANLRYCLDAIAGWSSDLHVVDSGSSDATLTIAASYGAQIHFHEYVNHASQIDWAIRNVGYEHEWLLVLDADNVVTPELKALINRSLNDASSEGLCGYYIRHRHIFRGQRIHGLKPWWMRLVRPGSVDVDLSERVDFRFIPHGKTAKLDGVIVEYNRKEDEISFWIEKHQRFANRMAAEEVLRRRGALTWEMTPRFFGTPDERAVWLKNRWYRLPLYLRPLLYFLYRYFLRGGITDGRIGFAYHALQAFWFRLIVDLRIQELEQALDSHTLLIEELARA
jgi:glycosyltransferase involved in cell wall biosynthesis